MMGQYQAIAAVAPNLPPDDVRSWGDALAAPMASSGIVTPNRIAAFIGQVAHESGGFRVLCENLNYSALRLCQVWPSRFRGPSAPATIACTHNPAKLANRVYAGRLGNGDEASGDGWRFFGAGLIQITGRASYSQLAAATRRPIDGIAGWLTTKPGASISACWYWSSRHLNDPADRWDIGAITQAINGGQTGAAERLALCEAALRAVQFPR